MSKKKILGDKQVVVKKDEKRKLCTFDRIISSIGLICQFALACTAVIAYFYTVIPIQQKERLAESLAKMEREFEETSGLLKEMRVANTFEVQRHAELQTQNAVQKKISESILYENTELTKLNSELIIQNLNLQQETKALKENLSQIQSDIEIKTTRIMQLNNALNENYMKIFQSEMSQCSMMTMLTKSQNNIYQEIDEISAGIISKSEFVKRRLTINIKYESIKSCLQEYENKNRFSSPMYLIPLTTRKQLSLKYMQKLAQVYDPNKYAYDSLIDGIVDEMYKALEKITLHVSDPRYKLERHNISKIFYEKISKYKSDVFKRDMNDIEDFFGVKM